jgi:hypothetical protein
VITHTRHRVEPQDPVAEVWLTRCGLRFAPVRHPYWYAADALVHLPARGRCHLCYEG